MRVIEAFDEAVRAVAASPDGRFLAAATHADVATWEWMTGTEMTRIHLRPAELGQFSFTTTGILTCRVRDGLAWVSPPPRDREPVLGVAGAFSGGVAVSPDGKTLVATRAGQQQQVTLDQWELPSWRPKTGIDYWSPFERLAFSPSGVYVAGIGRESFELRFAQSGGLNRRELSPREQWLQNPPRILPRRRPGVPAEPPPELPPWADSAFLTFPRHSE